MKFAAIVGVKDEVDLVEPCIRHLRAIGVDLIIFLDAGSTDGTLEVLEQYRSAGDFWIKHQSDQDPDADAWGRRATALARASAADWVLFLDADEFWMPAGGSLRQCGRLDDLDVLLVPRFNVPLGDDGPLTQGNALPEGPMDMLLITDTIANFRAYLEQNPHTPWIRVVPVPKVMVRPQRLTWVGDGFHSVRLSGSKPPRQCTATDLLIAHFPFTTCERFERKILNIRRVFAVHDAYFGKSLAWHWRRWLSLADQDSIREEFRRQAFDDATLAAYRRDGIVRSAAEWFAAQVACTQSGS